MAEIAKYGSKKFLSEDDVYSTGSICVHSVLEDWKNGKDTLHSATVVIKDCNKTISLEMCFDDEEQYKERAKKIDTMVEELIKFKGVLTEHWEILKKTRGEGNGKRD